MTPTWVQLVYLICAVCFILALKGLSGPKTARGGNLIGAGAAVVCCSIPFFYLELDHVKPILVAVAIGSAYRYGRRGFPKSSGTCIASTSTAMVMFQEKTSSLP